MDFAHISNSSFPPYSSPENLQEGMSFVYFSFLQLKCCCSFFKKNRYMLLLCNNGGSTVNWNTISFCAAYYKRVTALCLPPQDMSSTPAPSCPASSGSSASYTANGVWTFPFQCFKRWVEEDEYLSVDHQYKQQLLCSLVFRSCIFLARMSQYSI